MYYLLLRDSEEKVRLCECGCLCGRVSRSKRFKMAAISNIQRTILGLCLERIIVFLNQPHPTRHQTKPGKKLYNLNILL